MTTDKLNLTEIEEREKKATLSETEDFIKLVRALLNEQEILRMKMKRMGKEQRGRESTADTEA